MKQRLLSLALALVLCLGLTVPAMAAEKTVEEAIPCNLVNVGAFHEGLAWVQGEEQFGFIDKTGEVAIPMEYDDVLDFSEGLAAVQQKGKWGFIDKTGKTVIPCEYDFVSVFSEGLALAVVDGDKGGYIDQTGKEVIPFQYSGANPISDGLAAVEVDGKWGFIDKTGKEAVPCKYDEVGDFFEGLAAVAQNDKWGFIDKTGKEIVPCKYDYAGAFNEGFALVGKDDKYGFIDETGKEVIPCKYSSGGNFSEGLALVMQNDKWGFMDQTGEVVIPCQYDDAWGFVEGFAPVMQNDKWGYIDQTGEVVVPLQYGGAAIFSDGMAMVAQAHEVPGEDVTLYTYGYLAIVGGEEEDVKPEEPETPVEVTASVSDWAKEQVDSAAANGLIAEGLGDDYRVSVTRAQFAAVAVKLYEAMSGETAPAAGDSPFSDTSDPAVIQAEALGVVGGVGEGKFDPDSLVTREQAAVMLSRVYTKLDGEIPAVDATSFADDDAVSGYAKDAVAFMADKEIVGGVGDNKFDPQGNASIEQALVIAMRMFENLK